MNWLWLVVAVLLAIFVGLGLVAHTARAGTGLDHQLTGWVVNHRQGWLTTVAIAVTDIGSPVGMAVLATLAAAALWWRTRSLVPVVVVVATLAVASGTSTLTKLVVGSHRPPAAVALIAETDHSFPSGHVVASVTLFGTLVIVAGRRLGPARRRWLGASAMGVAAVVGSTRLYLGVHWLTDIVGGVLLGGAAVLIAGAVSAVLLPGPRRAGDLAVPGDDVSDGLPGECDVRTPMPTVTPWDGAAKC
jgi:membrane-associated phospholipid phosphatase